MAWKGVNNDQGIYFSSLNGNNWTGQQTSGALAQLRPALAVFNDRLYMAWKGIDGDQGMDFSSFDGGTWAHNKMLPTLGPVEESLWAAFEGRLYKAGKGRSVRSALLCLLRRKQLDGATEWRLLAASLDWTCRLWERSYEVGKGVGDRGFGFRLSTPIPGQDNRVSPGSELRWVLR